MKVIIFALAFLCGMFTMLLLFEISGVVEQSELLLEQNRLLEVQNKILKIDCIEMQKQCMAIIVNANTNTKD